MQTYQYRIGGRYFPAAPVECSSNGSAKSNGAAEAYTELAKALNIVGDYRLSTNVNPKNWGVQNSGAALGLAEFDYKYSIASVAVETNIPTLSLVESQVGTINAFCGTMPSSCFAMAINLETTNGEEISGLNATEQSDISFLANWTLPQVMGTGNAASNIEVYTYYDAMIVLRENNILELIQ